MKLNQAHCPAVAIIIPSTENIPPPTMPPTAIDQVALKLIFFSELFFSIFYEEEKIKIDFGGATYRYMDFLVRILKVSQQFFKINFLFAVFDKFITRRKRMFFYGIQINAIAKKTSYDFY